MANFATIRDGMIENISVAAVIGDVFVPEGTTVLPVTADAEMGGTHDGTNFIPVPRPPPRPPRATGAQMIYEAETRGKLSMLLTALSETQRAKLYARRRIVAGDDIAEALRAKLGVTAAAMASFIAAAAKREEV